MKATGVLCILVSAIVVSSLELCAAESRPDSDNYTALIRGDTNVVAKMLNEHPDWAKKHRLCSRPPLAEHISWGGRIEMVELLLSYGADVDSKGTWGRTALHWAAERGDTNMAAFLLKHGADVNARDDDQFTPIIRAGRSADMVKLLLAHGADINAHGGRNTLYSLAVRDPRSIAAGVVELILTNGVDVAVSEEEGFIQAVLFENNTNLVGKLVPYYAHSTNSRAMPVLRGVLEVAMDHGKPEMVTTIVSACRELETNLLHKAVVRDDFASVRSLLATNSTSLNRKDFMGWTPLHVAAWSGNTGIAKFLLSQNAAVDSLDELGNTPLHWATYAGQQDLVALLVRHKANLDVQGNIQFTSSGPGENTPLDFAIRRGFTRIAVMLITNGANLGPKKFFAETPLHTATRNANIEVMRVLLARGADVNARQQYSWSAPESALDFAVRGDSAEAVDLLIKSGASLQTANRTLSGTNTTLFHMWAEKGNTNIADLLLASGCDANAKDGNGQTPLHIAVVKAPFNPRIDFNPTNATQSITFIPDESGGNAVSWLLNHGVDVNAKDSKGKTPLHEVVLTGNTQMILRLLAHKADVNITNNDGKTPLALVEDLKMRESQFGHGMMPNIKAAEKVLLQHGATGPVLTPNPNLER